MKLSVVTAVIAVFRIVSSAEPAQWDNRAIANRYFRDAQATSDPFERIDLLHASLRRNPTYAAAFALGDTLEQAERYAEAADAFQTAYRVAADSGSKATACLRSGQCLQKGGQTDEALGWLRQALHLQRTPQIEAALQKLELEVGFVVWLLRHQQRSYSNYT